MSDINIKIQQIDAVLPQTQCGLCSYAGCKPYAEAIVCNNETINRCPPGGIRTLTQLAALTAQDPFPFIAEMQQKAKPAMRAIIREAECIGCAKCIQACPVDAILGTAKQMHTVLADECTGCELCVSPCPVDCIDMVVIAETSDVEQTHKANIARKRFEFRSQRLANNHNKDKSNKKNSTPVNKHELLISRKAEIEAAIQRTRTKKRNAVIQSESSSEE